MFHGCPTVECEFQFVWTKDREKLLVQIHECLAFALAILGSISHALVRHVLTMA